MDGRHVPAKLIGSVLCALCGGAIAVAAPHFILESSAWKDGAHIPGRSPAGRRRALPLRVSGVPGAAALALLVDDPDAPSGLFTPPVVEPAGQHQRHRGRLPDGAVTGTNDFGRSGWGWTVPPQGKPHRYRFHLYALRRRCRRPRAPIAPPSTRPWRATSSARRCWSGPTRRVGGVGRTGRRRRRRRRSSARCGRGKLTELAMKHSWCALSCRRMASARRCRRRW